MKRDAFVAGKRQELAEKHGKATLEGAVTEAVRTQAAAKGVSFGG